MSGAGEWLRDMSKSRIAAGAAGITAPQPPAPPAENETELTEVPEAGSADPPPPPPPDPATGTTGGEAASGQTERAGETTSLRASGDGDRALPIPHDNPVPAPQTPVLPPSDNKPMASVIKDAGPGRLITLTEGQVVKVGPLTLAYASIEGAMTASGAPIDGLAFVLLPEGSTAKPDFEVRRGAIVSFSGGRLNDVILSIFPQAE